MQNVAELNKQNSGALQLLTIVMHSLHLWRIPIVQFSVFEKFLTDSTIFVRHGFQFFAQALVHAVQGGTGVVRGHVMGRCGG
jgi:hypothetical protein